MTNSSWNPIEALSQTWRSLQSGPQANALELQRQIETWAETFGQTIIPIADFPLIKPLAKIPGLSWIAAALGQVNLCAIAQEIETQQIAHPTQDAAALSQQLIQTATLQAAGLGLATNLLPPLAITLFAVDLAAIATLQVELIYRIAATYGYDIEDPQRRGEVLALYLACASGSTVIKAGLSIPEVIPGLGAVIGASGDAAMLWTIGQAASQYYQLKSQRESDSVSAEQ